jgi:hypothetical protein
MLYKKNKREPDNSICARVKKEMAEPRKTKSARIAEGNLKKGARVKTSVSAKDLKRDNSR